MKKVYEALSKRARVVIGVASCTSLVTFALVQSQYDPRLLRTLYTNTNRHSRKEPPIESLECLDDLERLGRGRSVVLVTRGHSPLAAARSLSAFCDAASSLEAQFPDQLLFYVIDDASDATVASALLSRLGLEHNEPFAVILDRFIDTEEKYLMTQRAAPSVNELIAFVSAFLSGALSPAMLGQPRPPHDRSPDWPALWEVVTESFDEVVLDRRVDVFLEALSPRCDACMAFAPRMRMLSAFAAVHAPQLRIATMNILDNDKPRSCLPEVWLVCKNEPFRKVNMTTLLEFLIIYPFQLLEINTEFLAVPSHSIAGHCQWAFSQPKSW